MSQADLAHAANVARGTVQNLESGMKLNEGTESLIEEALGWTLGSLDDVRNGGEPTSLNEPPDDSEPEPEASLDERLEQLASTADDWIKRGNQLRDEIDALRQQQRRTG